MKTPPDETDLLLEALRDDLPTAADRARIRTRLLATSAALTSVGVATSAAANATSAVGAQLTAAVPSWTAGAAVGAASAAKLAAVPMVYKLGVVAALAIGTAWPAAHWLSARSLPPTAAGARAPVQSGPRVSVARGSARVASNALRARQEPRQPRASAAQTLPAVGSTLPRAQSTRASSSAVFSRPHEASAAAGVLHGQRLADDRTGAAQPTAAQASRPQPTAAQAPRAAQPTAAQASGALQPTAAQTSGAAQPTAAQASPPSRPAPAPSTRIQALPSELPVQNAVASTLGAESALLERALAALARGDDQGARALLALHAQRYPHGELQRERSRLLQRLATSSVIDASEAARKARP